MDAGATSYDDAVRAFEAVLRLRPTAWQAHLNLARIALRRGQLDLAVAHASRSTDLTPSDEAYDALGQALVRQGRALEAVGVFERALVRRPGDRGLRNQLASALCSAERLGEAEAELRALLAMDSNDVQALATLAVVELKRGHLDLAELILERGLVSRPDHPQLWTQLGLVALKRGDDQLALRHFERASQADPRFVTGRFNKAAVMLAAGDHDKARSDLLAVLEVEPAHTEALLALGIAERLRGDPVAARATWQRLLALDAEHPGAHFNLAVLDMDFGDKPADARTHLERFLARAPKDDPKRAEVRERLTLLEALVRSSQPP